MPDFDNTPPAARDLSAPFSNDAPAAKDLTAAASNTAPTAIAINQVPVDVAPAAKDLGAAFSDVAPVALDLAAAADNTPPAAVALTGFTPSETPPQAGSLPASTPVNEAPQYRGTLPLSTPNDNNVNTPILKIEGALVLNQIYGQTRTPVACVLTRVQLALEEPPVGGPVIITLVDAGGVSYGVTVTVADGETFGETVLGTPLALLNAANLRAKATAVGDESPGGFGVVTLFTQLSD